MNKLLQKRCAQAAERDLGDRRCHPGASRERRATSTPRTSTPSTSSSSTRRPMAASAASASFSARTSGTAYVVEVYTDTPASTAGIKHGDVFRPSMASRATKWTTDEVVEARPWQGGHDGHADHDRPSSQEGHGVPSRQSRAKTIKFPNIESKMNGKVGYIRLGQFNAKLHKDIARRSRSSRSRARRAYRPRPARQSRRAARPGRRRLLAVRTRRRDRARATSAARSRAEYRRERATR